MRKPLLAIFTFLCVIFGYAFAQTSSTSIITGETATSLITENSGNQYQTAKAEIISILPSNLWTDIEGLFKKFESMISDATQTGDIQQNKRKQALQDIIILIQQNLATGTQEIQANQVPISDMDNIIMPNVCKIATSYSITSKLCNNSISSTETGDSLYYIVLVGIVIAIFCGSGLLWYRITRKTGRGQIFLAIIGIIIISLIVFLVYNGDIIIDSQQMCIIIGGIIGLFIGFIIRKYILIKKNKGYKDDIQQKLSGLINASKEALKKEKYEEAINTCNEAIKIYENLGIPKYNEQEFYIKILEYQKSLQKTLNLLEESLKIDKNNKESFIKTGETLFALGRNDEAIQRYKEAIELYKDDKNLYYNLGAHLNNLGKNKEALIMFNEAIIVDKKFKEAYYSAGIALNSLGKDKEALMMYNNAIDIDKYYMDVYANKGVTLGKLGRDEEALETYNEAIKTNKYNGDVYFNKGIVLHKLGRSEEAIKTYNDALNISPLDKKIYLNKGAILLELKKYKEALECFDYIITKIDPLFIEAYINKGLTLKRLEKYNEAIKTYDEANRIDKNNFKIFINRGGIFQKLKQYDKALNECDEAIKIDKDCGFAYYGKACIYSDMKKTQEAIENLNIAIQKDIKWKEEAKKDEDFDNIRDLDEFKKIVGE